MMPALKMPSFVRYLCWDLDSWIVGSAITEENPRDWDVIVPQHHWLTACLAATVLSPRVNSFGGLKVISDNLEVDFWPSDLNSFFLRMPYRNKRLAFHPKSGLCISELDRR